MADLFISYEGSDRRRVQPIVAGLQADGWTVFWDRKIPAGQTWRQHLGRALDDARCILVAWSKTSVQSEWVIEEAEQGKRRRILVPLCLDPVDPPLGFRTIQAADLTEWSGDTEAPAWRDLVASVRHFLGGTSPLTEAAQRSPRKGGLEKGTETLSEPSLRRPFWRTMSILTLVGALLLTMAWLLPTQEVYSPLRGPSGAETEALEKKAQDMTRELDALAKKIQDATAQASKIEEQNSTASPEAARLPPVPVPARNAAQRSVDALMVRLATELDKLKRATSQQPQGSPELDAEIAKLEAQMQELRSNEQN